MLIHPALLMDLANSRRRELVAEAERGRLLAGARLFRVRRARRGPAVHSEPTGTLASCETSAAVPAR